MNIISLKKKSLETINFPVYNIRNHIRLLEDDNFVYVESLPGVIRVLDDKTINKDSLALRRLYSKEKDKYILGESIWTIKQFLISKFKTRTFIDSSGDIFKYKKTKSYPVIYYRIANITLTEMGYVVDLYNFSKPILLKFMIPQLYIGIIHINKGFLVYDTRVELPDKQKKIKI